MDIIFKKIPNWPYMVSNHGEVLRVVSRYGNPIMKSISQHDSNGYKIVRLHHNNKTRTVTVSRLMCEAFFGLDDDKQAAHKDGNRSNNIIHNLYWATLKQNCNDRDNHGNTYRGERHLSCKLTDEQVQYLRAWYDDWKKSHPTRVPNGVIAEKAKEYSIRSTYLIQLCSKNSKGKKRKLLAKPI